MVLRLDMVGEHLGMVPVPEDILRGVDIIPLDALLLLPAPRDGPLAFGLEQLRVVYLDISSAQAGAAGEEDTAAMVDMEVMVELMLGLDIIRLARAEAAAAELQQHTVVQLDDERNFNALLQTSDVGYQLSYPLNF